MKDWRFIYNRYFNRLKIDDGFKWDFPKKGMLISHGEDFLNDVILQKGECFVDVGANVGAWAIRASPYYQTVRAFEPNTEVFASLARNIRLNHRLNVYASKIALGNSNGTTMQAALYPSSPELPMRRLAVKTRTLDDSVAGTISVLKIDAEGEARAVIAGGLQSILNHHPTIVAEVHSEEESQIPELLPSYAWEKRYREMPHTGDWLYRENGKQVFLVGKPR